MKRVTATLALLASLFGLGNVSAAVVDWTGPLTSADNTGPAYTYSLAGTSLGGSFDVGATKPTTVWYDFTAPNWGGPQQLNPSGDPIPDSVTFFTPLNPNLSGTSTTIDLGGPAHYVALHFGGGSLLFYFQNAVSSLFINTTNITGTGAGLSAWASDVNPVPVPGAIWLLGTALLGFVGLSRRKAISGD
jgi:hypothetical protein